MERDSLRLHSRETAKAAQELRVTASSGAAVHERTARAEPPRGPRDRGRAGPARPASASRRLDPVRFVYAQYAREGSLVRRAHLRFLSSKLAARAIFGMRVERADVRTFTQFFDLTSVLLKSVVDRRLRESPEARLLEIGVGAYAILSGSLSRRWKRHVDGVDVDQTLIDSAREHIARNGVDVTVVKSDVLTDADGRYDVIFWNMPYYQDPTTYLPRLFEQLPDHLEAGGDLLIGYNTSPLARAAVEAILADYPQLRLKEVVTWRWNRHEVLRIGLAGRRPDEP